MKKLLIGTSALVAAASFVGAAQAAEPIKLSVGGYGAVMVGYASQDDSYLTATRREVTAVDVKGDNEIHFKGSTTLDNGLTVAVKYEIESGGRSVTTDSADEYSISLSGGFGTIVAGADDNALVAIAKGAPRVGGRLFNGGLDEGDLIAGQYVLQPSSTANPFSAPDATFVNTNGDSESISYISPAVYGFTFGATYVPDVGGDDNPLQPNATTAGGSNEAYGAGLMWNGSFSGVTLGLEGGYLWADAGTNTSANGNQTGSRFSSGREEWQLGGQISYAGFGLGAAYRDIKQDVKASQGNTMTGYKDELKGNAWEVGASYKTGPYGVSLSYLETAMENQNRSTAALGGVGGAAVGDDEARVWELAGEYTMGPGVALVAGVGYVDFENGVAVNATPAQINSNQNNGWVVATGLSLTF